MTTLSSPTATRPPAVSGRTWFRFLLGFLAVWGVLAGLGEFDATGRWGLVILLCVAATAVAVEIVWFRTSPRRAIRHLGLGRPRAIPIFAAAAVSGLVLLVFPLTKAVTGAEMAIVPNWPWILLGIFAFHGLAEEIVWRGFAFRRLGEGRTFRSAVLWTVPFIGAAHIPVVVNNGILVAIGAMLVAAVTSLPLGYLYLAGRGTIWAPALVHTAIDTFKLVVIPSEAIPTFSGLAILVSLLVPLLVFVVPRRLMVAEPLAAAPVDSRWTR